MDFSQYQFYFATHRHRNVIWIRLVCLLQVKGENKDNFAAMHLMDKHVGVSEVWLKICR